MEYKQSEISDIKVLDETQGICDLINTQVDNPISIVPNNGKTHLLFFILV